jgi:hypothetical protein
MSQRATPEEIARKAALWLCVNTVLKQHGATINETLEVLSSGLVTLAVASGVDSGTVLRAIRNKLDHCYAARDRALGRSDDEPGSGFSE